MPHDKIKAAARKRMAETGEPYTAARRAVVADGRTPEEHAATGQTPPAGAGYALAMSEEIHVWLAELRVSDPPAALRVMQALVTLMEKGASLGDPLVASTADSWPWVLMQALDRSHRERQDQLAAARRGEAAAATLIKDIQDQVAALETAQANLEDQRRRALDTGRPQEATHAAGKLAATRQQMAQARQLLPGVTEARRRLGQATQRLQARAEAIASLDLADDDGDRQHEDTSGAADAKLAEVIAQMERELGQQGGPEGLIELRPGAPLRSDIRILFAVEPPGTALLIAVLHGLEAVEEQFPEAVRASVDMLRRIRTGQAPDAAAHAYPDARSFMLEFYFGDASAEGSSQ